MHPSSYVCPVQGCAARIAAPLLVCRKHWFFVPVAVRREIRRLFETEQGSEAHRALCFAAIERLNQRFADGAL